MHGAKITGRQAATELTITTMFEHDLLDWARKDGPRNPAASYVTSSSHDKDCASRVRPNAKESEIGERKSFKNNNDGGCRIVVNTVTGGKYPGEMA